MSEPKIFGQDGQYFPLDFFTFYNDQSEAGGLVSRVMSYQGRLGNGQPYEEFYAQLFNTILAQRNQFQQIALEATAKLHVTLLDHRETATMASHNHESNITLAKEKIVEIDRELAETKLSFRNLSCEEAVLVHSDSESSGRSTPMDMDD